ncbi:hypothetical protein ACTXGO_09560 [Psychrobacter sp. T6-1]|uniref:hypothetical protein n=1 Tax=Psychrobacter sp. T6-1 TaxID=3457447 RepID=UPI003FD0E398
MIIASPVYAASAAGAAGAAGHLTFYYMLFILPIVLLFHLIAVIYFQKRNRYRSKAFTHKHLIIVILFLSIGVATTTFEYVTDLSSTGIHVGTLLSLLFV